MMPMGMTIPKNAIISSEDVGVQAKVPSTLPAASLKIISTALEFVYFTIKSISSVVNNNKKN